MPGFDDLVSKLYAGIESERPFQQFLGCLADMVNADGGTLIIERKERDKPGAIFSGGVRNSRRSAYDAFFHSDPFVALPVGRAVTIADHLGPEAMQNSDFMNKFMIPNGVRNVLGMDIVEPGGTRVLLRASRLAGADDFGVEDKKLFEALSSHIRQAITLFLRIEKMEAEREVFTNALNRLSIGAIVVDQDAQILRITEKAEDIFRRRKIFSRVHGRLALAATQSKRLEVSRAISEMAHPDALPTSLIAFSVQDEDGAVLNLVIRPAAFATRLEVPINGSALVVVVDATSAVAPSAMTLARLFQLTPAESELAALFGQGLDLDGASVMLGITKNTAKAHLRMIFSKTGVTRQSGLVRLILRSVDELS